MDKMAMDMERVEAQLDAFNTILSRSDYMDGNRTQQIATMFEEMGKLRGELLQQYPRYELQKFNKNFSILIKQIQNKLDNIIKEKESEKKAVSKELQNLSVKKKLSIYNR